MNNLKAKHIKPLKNRHDILFKIGRDRLTFQELLDLAKGLKNETSFRGYIYETIVIILIITKQLIPDYEYISDTKISHNLIFKNVKCIKELMCKCIVDGNNESDISVKINGQWCPFSIKYKDETGKTDLVECEAYMLTYDKNRAEGYGLGLVVKDINELPKHHDQDRAESRCRKKAKEYNLLKDSKDVEKAYNSLLQIIQNKNFKYISRNVLFDWINEEYLGNPRIHLKLKFNQQLARSQFNKNIHYLKHCLAHKPRSGKTISLLLMALDLLSHGYTKILIMTSVPDTIDSFIEELDKYYEFKDIKYKLQKDFLNIIESFKGIVFCSVQYLKNDYHTKKHTLELFDAQIFDECHFHSSNENTLKKIINIKEDIMQIFASGTSSKTEWFYDIPQKYIYNWSIEDECMMKKYINNK